jgi:hypothetical protein
MPVVPLPERPDADQIRKRAKDLLRGVRSGDPRALALVAEHAPRASASPEGFTLASAQAALARHHGFPSWSRLRRHLDDLASASDRGVLTVENQYRVHRGWASDDDVARCGARHRRPLLTARRNGVRVVVFDTPDGPLFAELTPTTTTLSLPGAALFHTAAGTIGGVVPRGTATVSVQRPGDRFARERAVVADGVFVVPNAFAVDDRGVLLSLDGARTGTPLPAGARAAGVVDRPGRAAERGSPAGRRLALALDRAAARPVVDPSCWVPGAHAELTETESVQLGRYGDLLLWDLTGDEFAPHVFDFGPAHGPVRDFAVVGGAVALTRTYFGFTGGRSDRVALVGLVDERRAASVVLRGRDAPDLPAVLAGGTLLITAPGLVAPPERGPVTHRVVVLDAAGDVVEDLPYQR